MLFNGNLDRSESNRKSLGALRQELKKWEETMTKRNGKKAVVEDPKEHTRKHKSEFDRLIELARPKKIQKKALPETSSSPAPQPATSDDPAPTSATASSSGQFDDAIVVDDE